MTAGYSNSINVAKRDGLPGTIEDTEDHVSLAPLFAGIRARGIADAFERSGTAAILLNDVGSVLHVGPSADKLLDGALSIISHHLVAETARSNRGLERLIAGAVAGSPTVEAVVVPRDNGAPIEVRGIHFGEGAEDPMQLMKAILVLRELPPQVK